MKEHCSNHSGSVTSSSRHSTMNDHSGHQSKHSSNAKSRTEPWQKTAMQTCGEWSKMLSSKGKVYYYNCVTEISQWQKPEGWISPDNRDDRRASQASGHASLKRPYPTPGHKSSSSNRSFAASHYNTSSSSGGCAISADQSSPKRLKLSQDRQQQQTAASSSQYPPPHRISSGGANSIGNSRPSGQQTNSNSTSSYYHHHHQQQQSPAVSHTNSGSSQQQQYHNLPWSHNSSAAGNNDVARRYRDDRVSSNQHLYSHQQQSSGGKASFPVAPSSGVPTSGGGLSTGGVAPATTNDDMDISPNSSPMSHDSYSGRVSPEATGAAVPAVPPAANHHGSFHAHRSSNSLHHHCTGHSPRPNWSVGPAPSASAQLQPRAPSSLQRVANHHHPSTQQMAGAVKTSGYPVGISSSPAGVGTVGQQQQQQPQVRSETALRQMMDSLRVSLGTLLFNSQLGSTPTTAASSTIRQQPSPVGQASAGQLATRVTSQQQPSMGPPIAGSGVTTSQQPLGPSQVQQLSGTTACGGRLLIAANATSHPTSLLIALSSALSTLTAAPCPSPGPSNCSPAPSPASAVAAGPSAQLTSRQVDDLVAKLEGAVPHPAQTQAQTPVTAASSNEVCPTYRHHRLRQMAAANISGAPCPMNEDGISPAQLRRPAVSGTSVGTGCVSVLSSTSGSGAADGQMAELIRLLYDFVGASPSAAIPTSSPSPSASTSIMGGAQGQQQSASGSNGASSNNNNKLLACLLRRAVDQLRVGPTGNGSSSMPPSPSLTTYTRGEGSLRPGSNGGGSSVQVGTANVTRRAQLVNGEIGCDPSVSCSSSASSAAMTAGENSIGVGSTVAAVDEKTAGINFILDSPDMLRLVDKSSLSRFREDVAEQFEFDAQVESQKFDKLQTVLYGELSGELKKLRALIRISEAKVSIHQKKKEALQRLMEEIESWKPPNSSSGSSTMSFSGSVNS